MAASGAGASVLEEVLVVGDRNLLGQPLLVTQRTRFADRASQLSFNRTVGDWIERLPGVSLNGQGGLLQSYSVRGFSRWRVRTEVAGVPIMTDRRAGNAASFVPPDLLAGVQVSSGPGSTLYGSDAMGGVVNLDLLAPDAMQMSASRQNNDNATDALLAGPMTSTLSGGLAARRAGSARDPGNRALNTGYRQVAATGRWLETWNALEIDLTTLVSAGRDIGKSNRDYPSVAIADYPAEDHLLTRLQVSDSDRWLARLYHHGQDCTARTLRPSGAGSNTRYRDHTVGGLLYASTPLWSDTGRTGVEWVGRRGVRIDEELFDQTTAPDLVSRVLDGDQDNIGLFTDQQWRVGELRVATGLRVDYIEQSAQTRRHTDQAINANVSVDYSINESSQISARWGTGFRFPTLSERYFNGITPRGDTLGNPDLAPERTRGIELAGSWSRGDLTLQVAGYHNELRDYIERYRLSQTVRSFRNTDGASITGFEGNLRWQASGRWSHRVSYQWQQGEDNSGRWITDLNPNEWRYFGTWQGERFDAAVDVVHRPTRDQFGPDEEPLAAATLANASLGWSIDPHWRFSLYANNLLDTAWLGSADDTAALQPGRTLGIRLERKGS